MTIYIVRHGQTIWNLEQRKQGHSDSPLTMKGIGQASHVAGLLSAENIDFSEAKVISSPLFRAQQYAHIVLDKLKVTQKPVLDHLVKEHAFGAWEGLTQDEVDERFPGETGIRMQNRWKYVIPGGGESYEIISKRVGYFLQKHAENDPLVVFCHEMISKVMRGHLLGLDEETILDLGHPQDTVYKISAGNLEALA